MQNLPADIKQRRIDQLMLLGSHDSAAYKLDLNHTTPMEKTPILNLLKDLAEIDPLIDQVVKNQTLSQPLSIFEQLEQGIRALDFRFLYNNITQNFYLSHSYATVLMAPVFYEIQAFLNKHPGEFLVIQLENDYEHRESTGPYNAQAIQIVENALDAFLIPVTQNKSINNSMTLENLVRLNQRVLFNFNNKFPSNSTYLWPQSIVNEYWPNGQTVNQSMSIIETYLPELKASAQGFLNLVFFTVTPDPESIFENLFKDSLFTWAAEIYPRAREFIASNLQRLSGLSIVSVDAPSDAYVENVIQWNLQIPS
ncbi:MAG: hypothetical protein WCK49_03915 [Myxococcaceae bacterium]